ncbi:MAG: FAD-binding protein [Deltaproteobacteria bacterium]|nr:FAD-binding protein [Deltaproteobacteria bacterium]
MIDKAVINQIQNTVGKGNVALDKETRICYSYDATNLKYLPDLIAYPTTREQISETLKLANEYRFPVIPRGAGTGFTGGTLPVQGGVVMVLTKMNKIWQIDRENLFAIVEPGVITYDLQQEVEKIGLFYPPDPASLKSSTIGGNVAECAGGPRALKYGTTKDYVLGLEVVLPTGEIISTGVITAKGVVGYDLTKLLVGSEGTLGIITKIILRLIPLPKSKRTLLAIFPTIDAAATTVSQIISSKIIPATLEFMDNACIRCVEDYLHMGLPVEAGALLIIEVDGAPEALSVEVEEIQKICQANQAIEIKVAKDNQEAEDLWKARRAVSTAVVKINPTKVNEDITVPRSKVPEILRRVEAIGKKHNLIIVNFGHAGDGNIHVNVMIDKRRPGEEERAHAAVKEIFTTTLELGGTLSGEHGIGITKAPYISMELGDMGLEVMRRIKKAFDPNNILNPGKIFPEKQTKQVHHL